jgi:hypothetical protein
VSAISLILLAAATATAAVSGAALHTARGLNHRIDALRAQLDALQDEGAIPRQGVRPAGPGPEVAAGHTAVPAARTSASATASATASTDEIKAAVAQALAEERERELAEARAFWAAQEARDADGDDAALLAGHGTEFEIAPGVNGLDAALLDAILEGPVDEARLEELRDLRNLRDLPDGDIFIPRQNARECEPGSETSAEAPKAGDAEPRDPEVPEATEAPFEDGAGTAGHERARESAAETAAAGNGCEAADSGTGAATGPSGHAAGAGGDSSELTSARRRHPSHPDFTLSGDPAVPARPPSAVPAVADHERIIERLTELAHCRTPLSDVRQGPLGTLDVYLFDDGTTVCVSPGHKEAAERLCSALRGGDVPVLLGGSTVSGAYALTFGYGQGQTAYLLADRVIASL